MGEQCFATARSSAQRMPAQRCPAGTLPPSPALRTTAELLGAMPPAQRAAAPNRTGLPDQLKAGIEGLSGMAMDDVRVHRNSSRPAQLNAHAYAQGTDIHLAPGQDHHLPHEAWHVVQQKQGRVQATMQLAAGTPVNDDVGLEHEADVMGARAIAAGNFAPDPPTGRAADLSGALAVAQRAIVPDWTSIKSVTASKATQVGVFFVTGADGRELVVKFENAAANEAFASEFIRRMSGGVLAPEATIVDTGGKEAEALRTSLAGAEPGTDGYKLLQKLEAFTGPHFIVMEKSQGSSLHDSDNPDPAAFQDPRLIRSIGELAAYDLALANYDRTLIGLNLGNLLHQPASGAQGPRITGIDQIAREHESMPGELFLKEAINAVLWDGAATKWAREKAKLIEDLYGVQINENDLDTGFMAGMLAIGERMHELLPLMDTQIAVTAGASAQQTVQRLDVYQKLIKIAQAELATNVASRNKEIEGRIPGVKTKGVTEGDKKCFLTTACVTARSLGDDCEELQTLRSFRDGFMRNTPDGPAQIEEYYRIAPHIVEAIDADPQRAAIYDDLYERLVRASIALINGGQHADALAHYRDVVLSLKQRFVPSLA
ncbi:CFI-box-CTERM domain-containing protein [Sphingomonas sp. CJ20]